MALHGSPKNYVLGNGNLFIADILPDGTYGPERHLGTVTAFTISITSEKYEYYTSNCGPKKKVLDVETQRNMSGGFTLDDSTWENLALGLGGELSKITHAALTVATEAIDDVQTGYYYTLGVSAAKPLGHATKIEDFTLKKGAVDLIQGFETQNGIVPENADYVIDLDRGVVQVLGTGTVVDGEEVTAGYKVVAGSSVRMEAGKNIGGVKKLRFKSCNSAGENRDATIPRASVSPAAEISFKGDEVQTLAFTYEVLEPTNGLPSIIIDGRAVA